MGEISERCSVSKWKPTAEQLQILEELYTNAYRKPSTDQIHHVANLLKRYGDLQAKNVYYWFQNRRAIDRLNKRRRLDEVQFKPAKIRTVAPARRLIGRSWQKMESLIVNKAIKGLIDLKKNSFNNQESKRKEKYDMGVEQIVHPGDDYNYEDIQLARPPNKNFWGRGWALSRINNMLEPSRTPQCPGLQECEDRKKPLQTLELFPLKPSDIKYREDHVVDSNCSVI